MTVLTARELGLVGCRSCGRAHGRDVTRCTRCGARLESRDMVSLQKVWAWWVTGLIAYIPANLYPMLVTTLTFRTSDATIVGGVVELWDHHAYGVAAVVFVASVLIPVAKFLVIAYLALILRRNHSRDTHRLHLFYEIVEFIGRWSMIDVFVVAILASLVQFGGLASIQPGIAALCFALSVIATMLAAQSFDSRLIWDRTIERP